MTEYMHQLLALAKYVKHGMEMSYNSLAFFVCLLFFLLVLFCLRRQQLKLLWIFVANLVFYYWACGKGGLIVILGTALIVYGATRWMEHIYLGYEAESEGIPPKEKTLILAKYKKKTGKILYLALGLILIVWIYVKIGKLMDFSTVDTLRAWVRGKGHRILVPLGISYYSLSAIGYLLDVYWRKVKPEHNLLGVFTAMTYFPHIVQGPISKYRKLLSQLRNLPLFEFERVCFGLQLMLWGYIKKMIIADRLVLYTSAVFADPTEFAGVEILIAVILCVFQLYADFSGCMDIVRGISQAIGVELDANFRQPLFAKSAAEFWRRWHMTLGEWTKEYIYLPIATHSKFIKWTWEMKKSGKKRASNFWKNFLPLIAVWLFTGLWHGTGWDYVVWGLYWCGLMTLATELNPLRNKLLARLGIKTEQRWYQIWQAVRTCILFGIGRMFTVVGGLSGCVVLWKQLFDQARLWTLFDASLYGYGLDRKDFYVALVGMLLMLWVDVRHERGQKIRETIAAQPLVLRWAVYLAAMFAIVIFGVYGSGYDASSFVYGGF